MLKRGFALVFGLSVALSWVAPMFAMSAMTSRAHACCQRPSGQKGPDKPCCCRPLDAADTHVEVIVQAQVDAIAPTLAAGIVRHLACTPVVPLPESRLSDASPPAPTGLSPPASA